MAFVGFSIPFWQLVKGFKMKNINIEYTNNKVDYGEPIYLKIFYKYELKIPLASSKLIDMQVERNSVCKR